MKKFIALVLSLVLALSLCAPAWGAEHSVSSKAEFDALTLADGDTVTLTGDITTDALIMINKAITLDLNGHSITRSHTNPDACTLYVTTTGVTIKDSAATNGAGIVITGAGMAIWVDTNASLTLTDVNVTGATYGILVKANGSLTVDSGTVVTATATTSEGGDGIRAFDATVTVNSGAKIAASSASGTGIESYGNTTVTMNGEITSGDYGVQVYGGTVTIDGDVTANTAILLSNEDGKGGEYSNNGVVNVIGGQINATTVVEKVNINNDANYAPSASITGGTFTTDVSEFAGSEAVAAMTVGDNTTYIVGEDAIKDEIAAAADNTTFTVKNGSVTLDDNTELKNGESITITPPPAPTTYTVTFNANGGTMADGVATQTDIVAGNKVAEPIDEPTKDGFTFGGWYTDEACTTAYDFDTLVTADITLYAKWTENDDDDNGGGTTIPGYPPFYGWGSTTTTQPDVKSPETFDAGIALYVGMSVMGAIGTVVLGKKRED